MLGEGSSLGFGARSHSKKYGFEFPFLHIRETLCKPDFVVGNLESPLSDLGREPFAYPSVVFRGSPYSIPTLHNAGFRVLSLANNHILQHGRGVFKETVLSLKKAGIKPVGLLADNGNTQMEVIGCNGLTLGFIGYSLWPSEVNESDNNVFAMVVGHEDRILDDIRKFAPEVDHLCVSMHWGYEFVNHPTSDQIELAHAMIEAGARCVLGHHPHVLQGIEHWRNGLIAYSLGNFVFDMHFASCLETIILELVLDRSGLRGYEIHPVRINNLFQPVLAEGDDSAEILSRMKEYSQRIVDPNFEENRRVACCKDESIQMKIYNQKLQNRYFMVNIWRFPWRFLFTKMFRKTRNILSGRYRKKRYQIDISKREER